MGKHLIMVTVAGILLLAVCGTVGLIGLVRKSWIYGVSHKYS